MWLLAILLAMVLIGYPFQTEIKVWYQDVQLRAEAEAAKAEREMLAPKPVSARAGFINVPTPVAPEWSKTVTIPTRSWFQIQATEQILVKNKKGDTKPGGPGHDNDWWGDFIADRTFQFQTTGPAPTEITITWEPK